MASALSPVFVALRIGLHGLVAGLVALVIVTAVRAGAPFALVTVGLAVVLALTYASGIFLPHDRPASTPVLPRIWVALLSVEWVALISISPEAIYLVFPLFFLYLHVLPGWRGPAAVVASTVLAIGAFGAHRGFSAAGIVGPVIGSAVALAIGLGYRSLSREADERESLIVELTDTRARLDEAHRAAGVLDERGRLAREIHDTVTQSLSSIVMLLHAAERSDDADGRARRMLQARDAASDALVETRHFINELSPPALEAATIVEALERLAARTMETSTVTVRMTAHGAPVPVPTVVETALLRVAQGALANVVQHARASRIDMTLTMLDTEVILDIVDNGIGFDADVPSAAPDLSFGLRGMRDRVTVLGGTLSVESTPGFGTSIAASFELTP
ncbi:hypothetical protein JF66_03025 [Cryobacterium sp. MLB-32]|nr:hypothetical protein JF66_03025 [Cryobacterium sp. MLB-32]